MSQPSEPGFFVGYFQKIPRDVILFCATAGAFLIGAFAALSLGLAYATSDPIQAAYSPGATASGVYRPIPYPMLLLPPDARHPQGHALLLAGDGKAGAQIAGLGFSGHAVNVTGALLKRGTIDMLIVETITASGTAFPPAAGPVPLGRWQIGGEICDGKCSAGAMKPGTGLAHKACANLCIQGGLPPLLVTSEPVDGTHFLLVASETGGPVVPGTWENFVARPVVLEGALERVGDLLVLKAELAKAAFP